MTSPRRRRTKLGTNTMAMAMAASLMSAPRSAATVNARTSGGKEKRASIVRMITESTAPRKNPAIRPRGMATRAARADDLERHSQRDASTPDQAAEDVAPEVVGPEPMRGGGSGIDRIDVLGVGSVRRDQGSEDGGDDHDQQEDQPGDGPALMQEADPESGPPLGQLVRAVARLGDGGQADERVAGVRGGSRYSSDGPHDSRIFGFR